MFSGKRIRVITIRKKKNTDVHSFRQKHINTSETGFNTCIITIEKNRYIFRKPFDQFDLLCGKEVPELATTFSIPDM
jgi:hypothetical protein